MAHLIPPPDWAPSLPDHLTSEQYTQAWIELCEAAEELLISGLRAEVGPGGDWRPAYRSWYQQRMDEHDEHMRQMLKNLGEREQSVGH